MKTIETKSAPAAIGPYSQAILANGFLYTSGQIPLNPETGAIEGQTIEAQAEQAIKNLGEILKAKVQFLTNRQCRKQKKNTIYSARKNLQI